MKIVVLTMFIACMVACGPSRREVARADMLQAVESYAQMSDTLDSARKAGLTGALASPDQPLSACGKELQDIVARRPSLMDGFGAVLVDSSDVGERDGARGRYVTREVEEYRHDLTIGSGPTEDELTSIRANVEFHMQASYYRYDVTLVVTERVQPIVRPAPGGMEELIHGRLRGTLFIWDYVNEGIVCAGEAVVTTEGVGGYTTDNPHQELIWDLERKLYDEAAAAAGLRGLGSNPRSE